MARMYSVMVSTSEDPILIGGFTLGQPPGEVISDMWAFGRAGWEELTPDDMPPPAPAAAYDVQSDRVILDPFAGCELPDIDPQTYADEHSCEAHTWVYDPDGNAWEERETATKPMQLLGARLAYDAESDRVILFGGMDATYSDATWAFDLETDTWTQMSPALSPPPRNYHVMDYDAESDRVILFGGAVGDDAVWAYDFNSDTWTEHPSVDVPEDRVYGAMVYSADEDRMILYGGVTADEDPFGDTWSYDFNTNTWTELMSDSGPGPRGWHAMAAREDGSVLLFGGGPIRTAPLADTWIYAPAANAWVVASD